MTAKRAQRSDSVAAALDILDQLDTIVAPPRGTVFSEAEEVIWNEMMRCKVADAWSDADKATMLKVVKHEALLRKGRAELEEMLADDPDASIFVGGRPRTLNNELQSLENHIIKLMRSVGITRTAIRNEAVSRDAGRARAGRMMGSALEESPEFFGGGSKTAN